MVRQRAREVISYIFTYGTTGGNLHSIPAARFCCDVDKTIV